MLWHLEINVRLSDITTNKMREKILLCLAHMSGNEMKYVQEAFDTNWVVPLGPNVNAFENDLKEFFGGNHELVALSAGTAAIHLGLVELGVGTGDEVICQSMTFCASANPIVYLGAKPIFVDSESETWNMSPELLEKAIKDRITKIGKKPKAIIVVHLYGMPAKIDEICKIAKRYAIPVLEDAAEALGSEYMGKKCGTFGDIGAISFNGNKMITTSGGGALIVKTVEEKKNIMFYATQAREPFPYYQHEKIGYNYRMSNICAGIGRGQMTILEEHIAHHRHIHALYEEAFKEIPGINLMSNPDSKWNANYWLCTILINSKKTDIDYDSLRIKLDSAGIETRPLWKPLHLQPVFKASESYIDGTSEKLFSQGLCLPAGPMVNDDDVNYIIEQIKRNITR